jgi:molybdopterin-binding protein
MTQDPDGIDSSLRIGAAASALGVSIDTLRRWERAGRIHLDRKGRERSVPAAEVARLLRERGGSRRSSARNRLDGVVVAVKKDGVMAQVELACGPYRIVSLMSREAADELGLEPGVAAAAVVKSTTVVVETG